jgi:hypothetical protein
MAGGAQPETDLASGEPPRKQMICHWKGDEEVRRGAWYALAQLWCLWGLGHWWRSPDPRERVVISK